MRCASCASPNASRRAITACIACSARRGISTHQGWRFSAGCSSSQSAILAIKRRPRWCAGSSRPSMSSTIQYSSGSQLACHCRSRFPVRLLPSCTTICACCSSLVALALPNQRSAHGSGCPVCDSTSPISGQPRVCAHRATFCPLPHSCARNHHAALLSPEEPVALFFTFQTRRFTQPRFVVLPPVTQTLLPAKPGIVHFAIQRFSKRAVDMDSPA